MPVRTVPAAVAKAAAQPLPEYRAIQRSLSGPADELAALLNRGADPRALEAARAKLGDALKGPLRTVKVTRALKEPGLEAAEALVTSLTKKIQSVTRAVMHPKHEHTGARRHELPYGMWDPKKGATLLAQIANKPGASGLHYATLINFGAARGLRATVIVARSGMKREQIYEGYAQRLRDARRETAALTSVVDKVEMSIMDSLEAFAETVPGSGIRAWTPKG